MIVIACQHIHINLGFKNTLNGITMPVYMLVIFSGAGPVIYVQVSDTCCLPAWHVLIHCSQEEGTKLVVTGTADLMFREFVCEAESSWFESPHVVVTA